jgi:hypothetical protein
MPLSIERVQTVYAGLIEFMSRSMKVGTLRSDVIKLVLHSLGKRFE